MVETADVDDFGAGESDPAQAEAILAESRGWPPDLLPRMRGIGWPSWKIQLSLDSQGWPTLEMLQSQVEAIERLNSGLQIREATWEDDERLSDLFANSTERLGDWDVTVHRSPNPFAQQRLQGRWHMKLIVEDHGAIASSAYSGRSSIVAGQKISVGWMGGWRVRNSHRKGGYAGLLMNTPGSATNVFGVLSYWYVRLENERANNWIDSRLDEMRESGRDSDRLTASVAHIDASPVALASLASKASGIRLVAPADIGRCVEMINATHSGLDLFRPYTNDFLEHRLDDLFWGPKPPFIPQVYGWADMWVLEEAGEVMACAGLWDRGRDTREEWFNRVTGEQRIEDTACAMDTGHAPGRADALATLLQHLAQTTSKLGRSSLSVALEFLPEVVAQCSWAAMRMETRKMETMVFSSPEVQVNAPVTRPYTDLAYW
jgi:hypothetical protein